MVHEGFVLCSCCSAARCRLRDGDLFPPSSACEENSAGKFALTRCSRCTPDAPLSRRLMYPTRIEQSDGEPCVTDASGMRTYQKRARSHRHFPTPGEPFSCSAAHFLFVNSTNTGTTIPCGEWNALRPPLLQTFNMAVFFFFCREHEEKRKMTGGKQTVLILGKRPGE